MAIRTLCVVSGVFFASGLLVAYLGLRGSFEQVPSQNYAKGNPQVGGLSIASEHRTGIDTPGQGKNSSLTAFQQQHSSMSSSNISIAEGKFEEIYIRVEAKFGRFFHELTDLSQEEVERLKIELTRQNLNRLVALVGESEGKTFVDLAREIEQGQKRLAQILSPSEMERLRDFQEAESYRGKITEVTNILNAQGVSIAPEDEQSLLMAYVKANQAANRRSREQSSPLSRDQIQIELMKALDAKFSPEISNAIMVALAEREEGVRQ